MADPIGGVVLLGLVSALAWGAGDFGGGLAARRAPLLATVVVTQGTGMVPAILLAVVRGEPIPSAADAGWAAGAGLAGVLGITALYRGLAVGRIGVVAPVTGLLAGLIPVAWGIVVTGLPRAPVVAGIAIALVAVVLVTRAPGHGEDRPSGLPWALVAASGFGAFAIGVAQLSGDGAFGPLAVARLVQTLAILALVVAARQPRRIAPALLPGIALVGLLDMAGNGAFILATQAGPFVVAAILSSLYPVVTVLLALVVLRERATRAHLLGFALTAAAIVLIGLGSATL